MRNHKHSKRANFQAKKRQAGNGKKNYAPCVECHRDGRPVTGAELFPNDPSKHRENFYACVCGAYVACDAYGFPKGLPAGPETREARRKAHVAGRALTNAGVIRDKYALRAWLAQAVGVPHNAGFIARMDAPTANRVTRLMVEKLHEARRTAQTQNPAPRQNGSEKQESLGYTKTFGEATPDFLASGAGQTSS